MGTSVVDPLDCLFVAMVAPPLLGVRLALAVVVVDSMVVVHTLAHLGLVVATRLVGLVDVDMVVDSVGLLATMVVHCLEARPPVA